MNGDHVAPPRRPEYVEFVALHRRGVAARRGDWDLTLDEFLRGLRGHRGLEGRDLAVWRDGRLVATITHGGPIPEVVYLDRPPGEANESTRRLR